MIDSESYLIITLQPWKYRPATPVSPFPQLRWPSTISLNISWYIKCHFKKVMRINISWFAQESSDWPGSRLQLFLHMYMCVCHPEEWLTYFLYIWFSRTKGKQASSKKPSSSTPKSSATSSCSSNSFKVRTTQWEKPKSRTLVKLSSVSNLMRLLLYIRDNRPVITPDPTPIEEHSTCK